MLLLSLFIIPIVLALGGTAAAPRSVPEDPPELKLLGFNAIEDDADGLARKSVGPINIDKMMDNNIERIRRGLSLFEPAQLVDRDYYWTSWIFANLYGGQLKRVSTMYRAGTCTLRYSKKIVTANLNIGWNVMSFLYGYYYDVFFWSGRGTIFGDLSNLRVNLDVDVDFSKYQIVFRSLKFHDNGKLDASSDGFWSNVVVKVAIWLAHDAILRQVEVMANDILAAEVVLVNKQIGPGHKPFTFVNLVKSNRRSLSPRSLEQEFAADEYHPSASVADAPSADKVELLEKVLRQVEENKMKNRVDV